MTVKKDKLGNLEEMNKELNLNNADGCMIFALFKRFRLERILKRLNMEKTAGIPAYILIAFICLFRVLGLSIYQGSLNKFGNMSEGCKNTYYRLMNRPSMNWRAFLIAIALRCQQILKEEGVEDTGHKPCLILDDTFTEKTGKKIEGVSCEYDHVSGEFLFGFKVLVLAFVDGVSTFIVDHSKHRESGKKKDKDKGKKFGLTKKELKAQFSKPRSKCNPNHERKQEADMSKLDVAMEMLKRAWNHGIRAKYVLADSWFTCAKLLACVRSIGSGAMHYVGLAKMDRTTYVVNGHKTCVQTLVETLGRNAKMSKKYKCLHVPVVCELGDMKIKLFLIRYGYRGTWNVLITTDKTLSFDKAFELYQLRWNIEVMFKETKQNLRLGRCQSRDFDAQIADCTLCFVTYNILAIGKRLNDYETMGELFRSQREELQLLTLWNRILDCVKTLLEKLFRLAGFSLPDFLEDLISDPQAVKETGQLLNDLANRVNTPLQKAG